MFLSVGNFPRISISESLYIIIGKYEGVDIGGKNQRYLYVNYVWRSRILEAHM